jgi:hypothetical protein
MNEDATVSPEREEIAFGRPIDWDHEARLGTVFFGPEKSSQFPPLPPGIIKDLIEAGHLDAEHQHNAAPTAGQLQTWAESVQERYAEQQLDVGLIGYMVSPEREDSRVAVTGVSIRSHAPIPDSLKEEILQEFSPDLAVVDDFTIRLQWD